MSAAPSSGKTFAPDPGEAITLFGATYHVQPHPRAPEFAHSSEGKRANVWRLRDRAQLEYALKVFKPGFRDLASEHASTAVGALRGTSGFRALDRKTIPATAAEVRTFPELRNAVLMPWLDGLTWADILHYAALGQVKPSVAESVASAIAFLKVMSVLEERKMAHTDIASGNVMLNLAGRSIELLDLEDLYSSEAATPRLLNAGTSGYRAVSVEKGESLWSPLADRYAAAILAAEILVVSDPTLAKLCTADGYFQNHHLSALGQERYKRAEAWLDQIAPDFADCFAAAWIARKLGDCPQILELRQSLESGQKNAGPEDSRVGWLPHDYLKAQAPPVPPVTFASFCVKCGTQRHEPNSRFCTGCGASFRLINPSPSPAFVPARRKTLPLRDLLMALLLAIIIYFIFGQR